MVTMKGKYETRETFRTLDADRMVGLNNFLIFYYLFTLVIVLSILLFLFLLTQYLYICVFDIMKYMRYAVGSFLLYCTGWLGGDVLISSIWIGVAFGFIDLMKQGKIQRKKLWRQLYSYRCIYQLSQRVFTSDIKRVNLN